MSERVVPTRPGWWMTHDGFRESPMLVVENEACQLLVDETGDSDWVDVDTVDFNWLAPVPSTEAVQAAVEAMRTADDVAEWAARQGGLFGVNEFRDKLSKAIAGLTGGEG